MFGAESVISSRCAVLVSIILVTFTMCSHAQDDRSDLDRLERQVQTLEINVRQLERTQGGLIDDSSGPALAFLFGVFCALWAQNSGRNSWLWFFLGLIFTVITVLFLLWKNGDDRRAEQTTSP